MANPENQPKIFSRLLLPHLKGALAHSRVVALVGARQSGKSTLAHAFPADSRRYISLDIGPDFTAATADPEGFIKSIDEPVTIDEIQRVPELLLPIKVAVDTDQTYGRFLLTGSADILTLPKVADSLAGRMRILELFPLSQAEIEGCSTNAVDRLFSEKPRWRAIKTDPKQLIERVVAGGYPELLRLPPGIERSRWFNSYLETMVRRDIVEIAKVEHTAGIYDILRIIAPRSGRIFKTAALSQDIGLSSRTIQRYLRLLEQTFMLFRLQPWTRERGRRYIHSPKVYINDTGLAAAIANIDTEALLHDRNLFGGLFESFVVIELRKQASWSETLPELFHFRLQDGKEIDLILEARNGRRVGVEIKASASFSTSDIRAFQGRVDDLKLDSGILLYTGDSAVPIGRNTTAVPVANLWTSPTQS